MYFNYARLYYTIIFFFYIGYENVLFKKLLEKKMCLLLITDRSILITQLQN